MISSELPELLGMCDRIAVMNNGTIAKVLNAPTRRNRSSRRLDIEHGNDRKTYRREISAERHSRAVVDCRCCRTVILRTGKSQRLIVNNLPTC
jgi:hypothetical protein